MGMIRMNLPDFRAARRGAALALVVAAVALSSGGCARKGDPKPPADAERSSSPPVSAPGEVTDPIRSLDE